MAFRTVTFAVLEIAYANKKLRELCESATAAAVVLGRPVAAVLSHRIADLLAVDSVAELVAGKPHESPDGSGRLELDISDGWVLTLTQNHHDAPLLKSGRVDWSKVSRVKVSAIEKRT